MAGVSIRSTDNPTLSEWACTFSSENPRTLGDVKKHHVVEAAHKRGVPLHEGRIEGKHAADLYFGLMAVMGHDL